jgi:hypothetical protein
MENIIDLKKEFANFKEDLIKGVKNLDIESFDEIGFLKFITDFYLPFLVDMAKFWSKTEEVKPGQFFTCCYACLDSTSKLMTENDNLKEFIDKVVSNNKYKHLLDDLLVGCYACFDSTKKFMTENGNLEA